MPSLRGPPGVPFVDTPTSLPRLPAPEPWQPLISIPICCHFKNALRMEWLCSPSTTLQRAHQAAVRSDVCSFVRLRRQSPVLWTRRGGAVRPLSASALLTGFCFYKPSCCKHSCAGFCVDRSCHVSDTRSRVPLLGCMVVACFAFE